MPVRPLYHHLPLTAEAQASVLARLGVPAGVPAGKFHDGHHAISWRVTRKGIAITAMPTSTAAKQSARRSPGASRTAVLPHFLGK